MGAATYGWDFYAVLLLLIPLAGGLVASMCRQRGSAAMVASVAVAACAVVAVILGGLFMQLPAGQSLEKVWPLLPWPKPLPGQVGSPASLGFLVDNLSMIMLLVVVIIGAVVILFSIDYLHPFKFEHPGA